jgi:AraC family transcriptional regulator
LFVAQLEARNQFGGGIFASAIMNQVHVERKGGPSYPTSMLLSSSRNLGWSTLFAELRTHLQSDGPGTAALHAEIAITVCGASEGQVACKVGGSWKSVRPTPGTIWLKPIGAKSDIARIDAPAVQVMHMFVPALVFGRLMGDYNLPFSPGRSIRYSCGVQDEVINQIGQAVLTEMTHPTAAGRLLVETSSLFLAARLAHSYLEGGACLQAPSCHGLDAMRLKRVLDYVEEHLADDIAVADLAKVACLSIFHFTRAFAAAVGMPPHRYVSQRRLERAKAMIAGGRVSLGKIAFDSQFSSQSSFNRAFRRATGMTPGEYRRASR